MTKTRALLIQGQGRLVKPLLDHLTRQTGTVTTLVTIVMPQVSVLFGMLGQQAFEDTCTTMVQWPTQR